MKKLILFGLLCFIGCSRNSNKQHEILCLDNSNHQIVTVHVLTQGNVQAFVVKGHSVLAYRDDNGKVQIVLLAKNDCEVY